MLFWQVLGHCAAVGMPERAILSTYVGPMPLPVVPMFHVNAWGTPYAGTMIGVKWVLPGPGGEPRPFAFFSPRIAHWDPFYRDRIEHMMHWARRSADEGLFGYIPAFEPGFGYWLFAFVVGASVCGGAGTCAVRHRAAPSRRAP